MKPKFVSPMLCQLAAGPFDSPDYIFEQKLDGVRLIATKSGGRVKLWTRNQKDRTFQFPEIAAALVKSTGDFVLDGEAVVYDKRHNTSFQLIQPRVQQLSQSVIAQLTKTNPAVYCMFDIINHNDQDLTHVDLLKRRSILRKTIKNSAALQSLDYIENDGKKLFATAKRKGWEGVVGKKKTSHYLPGKRGKAWQKIKAMNSQELVIGGFTKGYGKAAQAFGALLVGYYQRGKLIFAGEVGTGYTEAHRLQLKQDLLKLKIARSPFAIAPAAKEVTWIKPKLVAQVKFAEWTRDNIMRSPVYLGLRSDKSAHQVKKE